MAALITSLSDRGLRVSAVVQAGEDHDLDKPGKDSYRHREAGAAEVMVSSSYRWALMHERRRGNALTLATMTEHMTDVDLLLVEGFRGGGARTDSAGWRDGGQGCAGHRLAGRCPSR